jgi:hypothetical protein
VSDDRDWQHPAEHSAANNHGFIMNPPPLAKRLVALTATISLLTSFAVLFVAVPKGIDDYVDTAESTSTVPIVKASLNSYFSTLTANGVQSCAIQVAPTVWIASADNLDKATSGVIDGIDTQDSSQLPVRLYRSVSIPYLVVATTSSRSAFPSDIGRSTSKTNAVRLSTASVIDCMNHQTMNIQESATQFAAGEEIPVYVSGDIHGMAVVLNKSNSIMGYICEHNHSHWLLGPRILTELLNTAK